MLASLCSPNEDFGRPNKALRVRFWSTFQGWEYSLCATTYWTLVQKRIRNRRGPLLPICLTIFISNISTKAYTICSKWNIRLGIHPFTIQKHHHSTNREQPIRETTLALHTSRLQLGVKFGRMESWSWKLVGVRYDIMILSWWCVIRNHKRWAHYDPCSEQKLRNFAPTT